MQESEDENLCWQMSPNSCNSVISAINLYVHLHSFIFFFSYSPGSLFLIFPILFFFFFFFNFPSLKQVGQVILTCIYYNYIFFYFGHS